ncbi:TRAP transporter small permease subunit [Amorphus orientalis]|uniref:TRAP transporter small permease protein n=1 Tax=Amorphus orientalis TaxID=649198 RepID=A0AAE3VR85_9HYPH|nr:TRAP transporter small permease subunit [Amorphus orientalis]MDQ0316849.1 TRAP-type mannitol/chloroaromatic compound transport system permease small subunit [Amorphus orientalis]
MLRRIVAVIDAFIAGLGKLVALLILVIIAIMIAEMISRDLFSVSMAWAGELSSWLLVAMIFLGGPWALARGNFVRVDAVFDRFGARTRALVDTLVSSILFALFCGVLIKFGGEFALKSFAMGERSATGGWGGPVWAAKGLVPVGAILLVLAWISHLYHAWQDDTPAADPEEGL